MAGNGMNCGIISDRRYRSALVEEPPNRDRLRERTLKQALSSAGLLFGLQRCTEPTCARAYANDLAEHDSKQPRLCVTCKEVFAKRFREPSPDHRNSDDVIQPPREWRTVPVARTIQLFQQRTGSRDEYEF